jgi:hypothetical protein
MVGICWLIFCVANFDNLNSGAFRQFRAWRMGLVGLWIFMRPFMVEAEGFSFKYCHLESCGPSDLVWLIVFLI